MHGGLVELDPVTEYMKPSSEGDCVGHELEDAHGDKIALSYLGKKLRCFGWSVFGGAEDQA